MANAPINAAALESAFSQFNEQSNELEKSYRELEGKVTQLTCQLTASQSARHRELLEKEFLSNRLSRMLEVLPGAIIVIDEHGVIRERNTRSSQFLGSPLLGHAWREIARREFCPGESTDGELRLKGGRWLSLSRQTLGEQGEEILLLTDITETRRMSELMQRQQRLSGIGEMMAKLGHQIRTPLAAALLYASQLGDTATANQRKSISRIMQRLHDLRDTVDDLLYYAGGAKRSGEPVNASNLLKEVLASVSPQLTTCDSINIELSEPDIIFEANGEALKGALSNLVTNSLQSCTEEARIELAAIRSSDQVFLTVTDNGPGIPEENRERVFEPFFTTRPQGTGLGLAVVRSVAEAHDGEVLLDSGPSGTTVAICLPQHQADVAARIMAKQEYA